MRSRQAGFVGKEGVEKTEEQVPAAAVVDRYLVVPANIQAEAMNSCLLEVPLFRNVQRRKNPGAVRK